MVERERTIPRGVGILGVCMAPGIAHRTEVRSMDQLIPSLAILVEPFRDCFHPSVFSTFQALLAGWIVCLGPRTISEVWQATGLGRQAAPRHRLRRLPLRRLGVGRPGHRPGHPDPQSSHPRWRGLDRRR